LSQVRLSRIKIDHIADSLLKLQIKIGVRLINDELSQLLTPVICKSQLFIHVQKLEGNCDGTSNIHFLELAWSWTKAELS